MNGRFVYYHKVADRCRQCIWEAVSLSPAPAPEQSHQLSGISPQQEHPTPPSQGGTVGS